MNMLSYWLFFLSSLIMISSLFAESGPANSGWTIYPPLSALPQVVVLVWYDIMVGVNGYFHCILNGIVELYSYGNQFEDRGNVHD
jgi:heme/copper-type cytochrome/quinol oxidase subunit 1